MTRQLAIGDIHGCYRSLRLLADFAEFGADDTLIDFDVKIVDFLFLLENLNVSLSAEIQQAFDRLVDHLLGDRPHMDQSRIALSDLFFEMTAHSYWFLSTPTSELAQ